MSLQTLFSKASAPIQHWLERAEWQLKFAEHLCELHPGDAPGWRPVIDKARARVAETLEAGCLDNIPHAVAEAEAVLEPLSAMAKSYTVHCVGHGHIDMNWMWSWPETVAITVDTFATVLRLMDEYPAFKFSQSQASIYAIAEQYAPELLERIAQRVREGRWEVTASHWVECDKNMPGSEALCRQLLYTCSGFSDSTPRMCLSIGSPTPSGTPRRSRPTWCAVG